MLPSYCIRKLKHRPGSYYIDFRHDGKRHVLSLETADRKIAKHRAEEIFDQVTERRTLFSDGRVTVERFLQEYRAWVRVHKKPRTVVSEENALRAWAGWNKVMYMRDITPRQVDLFIQHLCSKPAMRSTVNGRRRELGHTLKAATVHSYAHNLRTVFNTAKRWGYVQDNPFSNPPLPTFEKPLPRIYSPDEIRRILHATALHSPDCLDLFVVYFLTGMRASELLKLEWQHVIWQQGIIALTGTKGRKARFVPLGPIVRSILERRLATSPARPFDGFVRVGRDKRNRVRKYDLTFVSKEFTRMLREAGIQDASLKRTRGTYATALLEVAGVSLLSAQSIVGHADIETTRTYYHNPLGADTLQRTASIDAQFRELLPKEVKEVG